MQGMQLRLSKILRIEQLDIHLAACAYKIATGFAK